jgi:hypothetical protein
VRMALVSEPAIGLFDRASVSIWNTGEKLAGRTSLSLGRAVLWSRYPLRSANAALSSLIASSKTTGVIFFDVKVVSALGVRGFSRRPRRPVDRASGRDMLSSAEVERHGQGDTHWRSSERKLGIQKST